jgi:mitotic spindle assembly checkpoint protein MAD1
MPRYQQASAYDIITGGDPSPRPPRQQQQEPQQHETPQRHRQSLAGSTATFKQSTMGPPARPDAGNEDLRAQLRTLQYELDSLKQERELATLETQQELRDVQARAEEDFRRAQTAERERDVAVRKAESATREAAEERDRAVNEKMALEKKCRGFQEDARQLRVEVEEARAEGEERAREAEREVGELRAKGESAAFAAEEARRELDTRVEAVARLQRSLAEAEERVGGLEGEVVRLKTRGGDEETLALVKKELSTQVDYIRKLEGTNREQSSELKGLRKMARSVEVVEEEKRALEAKVGMMEDLRRELSEAQLQRRILEDEKRGWTSYLEAEGPEGEATFDTPEQMAKAFLQEKLERLSLVDQLGSVQPELLVKEENIRELQEEKARLMAEIENLRTSAAATPAAAAPSDAKARARLERQKNLAVKEVEYLRAQMKTFEAEEAEFNSEQIDEEHTKRVHELETMLEQYRSELQSLHADLTQLELQPPMTPSQPPALSSPRKRSREEDDEASEENKSFRRKLRTAQEALAQSQKQTSLLEAELKANAKQLAHLKDTSRTRILELRSNPTADAEAIKLSTLRTLREENAALLAQVEGNAAGIGKVVPTSTLAAARLTIEELTQTIQNTEKKTLRLKQIFKQKSLEFREAVASILGWKLDFMPNGRVKATSILYPHHFGPDGEEEENSITFDGENGTMKVSGGPKSVFAGEIRQAVEFWVEGRNEIPCLLAALTLEFYERTTRAQ